MNWLVKVRWTDDGTVDTWTCEGTHLIGGSVLHLIATRERNRGAGTAVPAEVTCAVLR